MWESKRVKCKQDCLFDLNRCQINFGDSPLCKKLFKNLQIQKKNRGKILPHGKVGVIEEFSECSSSSTKLIDALPQIVGDVFTLTCTEKSFNDITLTHLYFHAIYERTPLTESSKSFGRFRPVIPILVMKIDSVIINRCVLKFLFSHSNVASWQQAERDRETQLRSRLKPHEANGAPLLADRRCEAWQRCSIALPLRCLPTFTVPLPIFKQFNAYCNCFGSVFDRAARRCHSALQLGGNICS